MKQNELSPQTIKKLTIIHQTLPVLSVQFLHLLLSSYNKVMRKKLQGTLKAPSGWQFDVQIFNMNVSCLNLPQITN